MRHKQTTTKNNNLRILRIFCLVVFLLIAVSLIFRFVTLIQTSQFDGSNRFTMAFVSGSNELDIVSFDPQGDSLSHVAIDGVKDINAAKMTVGVFTDTTITLSKPFSEDKSLSSYMIDALLSKGATSTLTSYDLLRLGVAMGNISDNSVHSEQITLPLERVHIDEITGKLFVDTTLSEENQTIEIVNGTGIAGLGGRLERALTTMGANVISVTNADTRMKESSIIFYGKKSYTVQRLEKLLVMPVDNREGRGLSDIIIVIGQDKEDTLSY